MVGGYQVYLATLSWTDSLVSPWNIKDLMMVLKLRFATTDHYLLGIEFPKTSSTAPLAEAEENP